MEGVTARQRLTLPCLEVHETDGAGWVVQQVLWGAIGEPLCIVQALIKQTHESTNVYPPLPWSHAPTREASVDRLTAGQFLERSGCSLGTV